MAFVFANNVNTTLFAACTATATSIAVTDATNLPTTLIDGQQLALVITSSASAFEVVYVTAIDGTTLTVLRGQEGSTAQAWAAGVTVMNGPTQGQMASFVQSVSPANPTPLPGQMLVGQGDTAVPAFVTAHGDATVDATGAFVLSNTGVAAGVYGGAGVSSQITVSAEGRVTAAENVANGGEPPMLPGIAAATNVNVTVATPGSNIDGYVLSAGDIVLLTAQSTSSQNGLWQFASATLPLVRPTYSAVGSTLSAGTEVSVGHGSTYTGYTGTLGADAVVGTDAQGWTLRPQVLTFTAPLMQTGKTVTLGVTPVASGGTGVSTLAADGVLVGNGSGPVTVATTGNAGNLLVDQGSGNAPVFVKMSGDATLSDTGVLTLSGSAGVVTSVFGRAGAVTGQAGDYVVQQVTGAAPLASPVFTGTPQAPTQPLGTDSDAIATTAFVQANAGSGGDVSSVFGRSGAVIAEGGDYAVAQITGAAPLASPVFTGNPTAPTPADGDNSTSIATTAFVTANAGGGLVTSVFGRKGAVTALAGDYAVTQITGAAPLASPEFSGVPTVPTPAVTDNTTQIANTEYVQLNTKKAATVGNGAPNVPGPVPGQMYIDETNSSLYAYYASESTASPQYVRTAQAAGGSNPDLEGGPNANNVVLGTLTMWNNAPAMDDGWSTLGTLQPSGQETGTALGWVTGVTALPLMNNNGTAVNTAIEISGCAPPVTWALVPAANQVEYAYSVQPSTINDLIIVALSGSSTGSTVTFTATDSNGHANLSGLSTAFVAAWVAGTTDVVTGTITVSSATDLGSMAVLALQPIDGNDAWQPLSNDVTSVFGRAGAVIAEGGDYTVAQVIGAAPLDSPALTGSPTAPTAAARDDSTKIATTAYVAQNTIGPVPAAAGDIPVGNAAATAYASVAVSGDATLSDTGVLSVVSTHLAAPLPVAQGGTSAATLPANAVLIGNGSDPVTTATTGNAGNLLVDQGAGTAPLFVTMSGDATMTKEGVVTLSASFGDVTSVFGRQGAVQAATGDYTVAQVTGAAPLDSPALTGNPTAPTPAAGDDSTKIATTAYVAQNTVTSVFGRAGAVTGQAGDYTVAQVTGAAPLDSPALTGTPMAPTPAAGDDSTKIATTAYVAQNTIGPVPAAAGDVLVGNAAATAYASVAISGDATLSDAGALTVSSTHLIAALPVAQGGTSASTLPANAVLIGNGTGAPTGVTMTDGQLLVGVTGSAPIAQTVTGDVNWNGASAQVVSTHLTDPLSAPQGGLGAASLTAHGVVVAEGASAATVATTGTAGRILLDQGANADPLFAAMSGDATITEAGSISVSSSGGVPIGAVAFSATQTGSFTLAASQANTMITVDVASTAPATVTIPASGIAPGSVFYIRQAGAGAATLAPASGVTVLSPYGLSTSAQGDRRQALCISTTQWDVI